MEYQICVSWKNNTNLVIQEVMGSNLARGVQVGCKEEVQDVCLMSWDPGHSELPLRL